MSPIARAVDQLSAEVAGRSAALGRRVEVADLRITDRTGVLPLAEPGLGSPNGACRLFRAADGWCAVNLAREEDRDLVAAWMQADAEADPWATIVRGALSRSCRSLLADAEMLGLPAGRVGEVVCDTLEAPRVRLGQSRRHSARPKVVDLSALWAGPMCGAILAAAGAQVLKVESTRRPDPTRHATPEFFTRLNGAKAELALDLRDAAGQARLRAEILAAEVVITSARPRGLASLGLSMEAIFADRPGLVWVAITGYGWSGEASNRVAFGDDAAAAGGLVRWSDGEPRFLGDALADPVTGLSAAAGALTALQEGGGVLVDVALARSAAGAAAICGLRRAA